MTLPASDVTACLVTRGDVDLQPILDSLIFPAVIVHDNSRDDDVQVLGRYLAAAQADTPVVYFQDDDVILTEEAQHRLLDLYRPGRVVSNMGADHHLWEYPELTWVGHGALCGRQLAVDSITGWIDGSEPGFRMVGCDILLSLTNDASRVDLGHQDLQHAHDQDRVHRHPLFGEWKRDYYQLGLRNGRYRGVNRTKLNLGCGGQPLVGFHNLDKTRGWAYENGLSDYADGTVAAITISHSLMYVREHDWPAVFAELLRVLEPGGVLRITEDSTADPASERHGGHHDAVTLTSPRLVADHCLQAGFSCVADVPADQTGWIDDTLIQQWHGAPPKVFHIEAVA